MRAVVIGASGGIGWALAEALLSTGAEVHGLSRSGEAPAGAYPGRIDLERDASIAAAAYRIGAVGVVDLVLVATGLLHDGRVMPEKSYRDLEAERLAAYFAINSIGPALVAKHFLPLLPRKGRAVFAALSARVGSISDNRLGGWHGYRASKAALNMLVKTLALELARGRPGALCVALHPGTVDTGLSRPFQRGVPQDQLFAPARAARYLLDVISNLGPTESGGCFAWDGQRIPA
jgi:NAD(P)-dependent dehydrogenase (short-subunit alcohol dehydrogenase family)